MDHARHICPVCSKPVPGPDHRWCLVELFKANRIQTLREWEKMCIVRKKIRV
jgi:hypothetical protein